MRFSSSPDGTASGATRLAAQLSVPLLTAAYALGFLGSVAGMSSEAANYPLLVIAALLLLVGTVSVVEIRSWAEQRRAGGSNARPDVDRRNWRSLAAIGLMIAFVYAAPRAGFYPAAAGYLLLISFVLGVRHWIGLPAFVGGCLAFTYLVFTLLLQVALPT